MPFPEGARDYLLKGLAGTPIVLRALVADLGEDSAVWDRRPDLDRFTLREVIAHLADWESIWLERLRRICQEDHPFLPSIDESELAVSNGYGRSSPEANLERFRVGRRELIAYLSSLSDSAWERTGDRQYVGVLTMQQQAAFALSHDCYHLRQVAEWVA